jgi:hypothetical protein
MVQTPTPIGVASYTAASRLMWRGSTGARRRVGSLAAVELRSVG